MCGVKDGVWEQIRTLAALFGADKIVLFGSRSRGDYGERSDIDLAVWGLPDKRQSEFYFMVNEETDTLLKFDVVFITDHTSDRLLKNIEEDGVIIYERSGNEEGEF